MRILIAEDEQRTRQGLVRVLQSLRDEYEIVAQASNGIIRHTITNYFFAFKA